MIRVSALLAAALVAGITTAAHAAKPYDGDYLLTFFIDPGSYQGTSYCLELTQTGNINGFTDSGTVTDTGGLGLAGDFVVDGTTLHVVIISSPHGDNAALIGKATKSPTGAFDDFVNDKSLIGTGTFTLTPGCGDAPNRPLPAHSIAF